MKKDKVLLDSTFDRYEDILDMVYSARMDEPAAIEEELCKKGILGPEFRNLQDDVKEQVLKNIIPTKQEFYKYIEPDGIDGIGETDVFFYGHIVIEDTYELLNTIFEENDLFGVYYLWYGQGGWQSAETAPGQFIAFHSVQEFLEQFDIDDRFKIKVTNNGHIEFSYPHHDGTNYYEFRLINNSDKIRRQDLIHVYEECFGRHTKDAHRMTKDEIIEFLSFFVT